MSRTKKHNKGFSLIELLIAITILSIVMIMVIQFMATTSGAYRKTKKNLNIQTEAMTVLEQMSDTLMQARYIRVVTKDQGVYTITKEDTGDKNQRVVKQLNTAQKITFDFVPDNYGNYSANWDLNADDKDVIVNFDDFKIVNKQNKAYPLENDKDKIAGSDVRSFRMLKTGTQYNYVKPEYIYAEHVIKEVDPIDGVEKDKIVQTLYHITDITNTKDKTCSIYMWRVKKNVTNNEYKSSGMNFVRQMLAARLQKTATHTPYNVDASIVNESTKEVVAFTNVSEDATTLAAIESGVDGLLSDHVLDFYLSADVEGNAFLTNIMFYDGGYEYNTVETINFRNSNVLTVRPQNLYKVKGSGHNADIDKPEATTTENSSSEASGGTTETP